MKFRLYIYLSFVISLMGCTSSPILNTSQPTEAHSSAIALTSTLKPTPIFTEQATLSEPFLNECINLNKGLPPPVETAKQWLLLREDQAPYHPYLLNLANGIKKPIDDRDIVKVYISPDQQTFAYDTFSNFNQTNNKLVIKSVDGKVIKVIPWQKNWTFFWGWLDNNHLMVTEKADDEEWVPSLVILDFSDGSSKELKSEYPNFDNVNYLPWQHNRVIYDTTLTLAVYPSYSEHSSSITLFNIPNKKELATVLVTGTKTAQPQWSLDNKYLLIIGTTAQKKPDSVGYIENYNQELFSLERSGETTRLTHFADKYSDVRIGNASWSPNGQYIAFWFRIGEDSDEQLAVLDLNTKLVTNYCLTGTHKFIGYSTKPIWSPDSRIILVDKKENEDKAKEVIWVDVKTEQGAIMGEDISVEGWLISQ